MIGLERQPTGPSGPSAQAVSQLWTQLVSKSFWNSPFCHFLCFLQSLIFVFGWARSGEYVWAMLFVPLVDGSVRSGLPEKQGKVRTSAFFFFFLLLRSKVV